MNERLAKLTEQCYEYNETMQGTWFNKTKFAELIVRECAMLANDHVEECEGVHFGVGRAIKNYFGVE
jgi:hypothetical protein